MPPQLFSVSAIDAVIASLLPRKPSRSRSILHSIFEAFITDKETGTGLGLTISYDIVTKHGGRIQAENNPGRGATFSVWLPTEHRETQ